MSGVSDGANPRMYGANLGSMGLKLSIDGAKNKYK